MEVGSCMSRNLRGWFVLCGDNEEIKNLTKKEALSIAESMAEKWLRVLVYQACSKNHRGICRGGIAYGHRFGCCIAEIREI